MKIKLLLVPFIVLLLTIQTMAQETGTFTDTRDGKTYKTIKIGKQTWMAENLAYKASSGCWAYDNKAGNVSTYGYLYTWNEAKKACPTGWHLPTDSEWSALTDYLGGEEVAGGPMKSTSGWENPNKGASNSSGFSGLPGGYRNSSGTFSKMGTEGYWWSSYEFPTSPDARSLSNAQSASGRGGDYDEEFGYSVRFVKD
jgi:uncharacterized protein (TIGR02145 family)